MSSNLNLNSHSNPRNTATVLGILGGIAAAGVFLLSKLFETSGDEEQEQPVDNRRRRSRGNFPREPRDEEEFDSHSPILNKGTEEYNFWTRLFRMIDLGLEEEFKSKVRASQRHIISWDFWIEGGYVEALREAIFVMRNKHADWQIGSIEQLLVHAQRVRDLREEKLRNDGTHKYESHFIVFKLWDDLCNSIDDLLERRRNHHRRTVMRNRGVWFDNWKKSRW